MSYLLESILKWIEYMPPFGDWVHLLPDNVLFSENFDINKITYMGFRLSHVEGLRMDEPLNNFYKQNLRGYLPKDTYNLVVAADQNGRALIGAY